MKIVNDRIKNALKQPTTQRKGRILVNNNYYEVYNVEYYADAYNEGNVIGNAIASQLDFELPYMPKFETFKYFDGVWTGSNYEYVDMGTFHVFDEQDEDDFNKHITAFDNLIKFNAPFNDVGGYPKTLFQELQNVCNQAGVNLQNISITNGNFEVVNNQFVNGESLKTVLKAICQISGTYAKIKNDEVVLQLKNQTNEVINKEQHEPTIWKRRSYGINQVILGLSDVEGEYVLREDAQDIVQNGVHKLVINDNPFAYTQSKRDELIDELFNQVRGFGYMPYEMNGEWLNYLEIGDIITLDDVETIVLRINGKSPKSLESMMSAPAIIDSSVEYINNTNTVKNQLIRTEISVDKQNQQIEAVISQTDEQNQKIARVTQTVDELNSKISDIADITISGEDTDAQVELENINESEPIRLVIRPIGESISYLYPSNNLFPSDTLFSKNRKVRFTNTKTNEFIDYELPTDLLYYDSENYDEFILDYDGQSCIVNKKVGYNADGTTYVLDNPTTLEFEYPRILLTDGDYNVTVLGYDTAYLFVRLMTQNIYTTQFYTKAETDSKISQTSEEINLSVNQKLSNYSTTTEMNSAIQITASGINQTVSQKVGKNEVISTINQSAEAVTIDANKVNISGVITAINNNTSTTIDGDKITTGSITAEEVSSDIITTTNFSAQEINANNITSGTISADKLNGGTITASEINLGNGKFSVNDEGVLNSTSGVIGGFTIEPEKLTSIDKRIGVHSSTVFSGDPAFYAGGDPWTTENWNNNIPFYVTHDGYLKANNASIAGSINAGNGSAIGGLIMSGGILQNDRLKLDAINGSTTIFPISGGSHILSNAARISATAGVGITSNSNGVVQAPTANLDLKACSGARAYLGCMRNADGTDQLSAVTCANGELVLSSKGTIWANGSAIGGSSSKNTKTNIEELSQEKKDELYGLIKNIPLYEYDYKPQYGKATNYGFLIEDIEDTKLNNLLHIVNVDENIKTYCSEDLTRINLIIIKELMKKIETLENKIKELESDKNE